MVSILLLMSEKGKNLGSILARIGRRKDAKRKKEVVSSMVERLVYTEAAESSNPSLPSV